jgi:ribosomal protein L7/L12
MLGGLDCRKCGATVDDPGNTGRCRFCSTPYRADAPVAPSFAAGSPGHAVIAVADVGQNKIAVIKALHTTLKNGLKEAKDLSEQRCPFHITIDRARAPQLLTDLTEAGARAQIVG